MIFANWKFVKHHYEFYFRFHLKPTSNHYSPSYSTKPYTLYAVKLYKKVSVWDKSWIVCWDSIWAHTISWKHGKKATLPGCWEFSFRWTQSHHPKREPSSFPLNTCQRPLQSKHLPCHNANNTDKWKDCHVNQNCERWCFAETNAIESSQGSFQRDPRKRRELKQTNERNHEIVSVPTLATKWKIRLWK